MSHDDVSEMIKRLLEQDEVPAEFCELVYQKTRGNPFFVEEVVKSLKEEEVIFRKENQWKVREVSKIEFPKTVKSVIKARVGRLDDECQNLLTLASFVGNDFSFESLCGVTGLSEDKVLDLMEQMLKTGLVKERVIRGQDVYSFADIIVRDVVHEEVSHLRHKKLHGVVGSALEKVYEKKVDEHLGELALHFLEFGDEEKALDYFLRAGDRAAKIYANNEAFSYFHSGLKLLEGKEGVPRERGRVLEKLGDIKSLAGEHDACMKYWNDALLLWKQVDENGNVARLHRKMATVLWDELADIQGAKEHQEAALKILESEPENVELAILFEDMGHMYYRIGDMTNALSWAEKALELAKKLNEYEVISSSYTSMGTVFSYTGETAKAIECLERALKITLDNGYLERALRAYNNLGVVLPVEEAERSLECYEKGYELAKKVGDIKMTSFIGTNLGNIYVNMGNVNKALQLTEESVALDRKAGYISQLYFSVSTLGQIYQMLGEWDKSEQYYKEVFDLSQKTKEFTGIASGYFFPGWLCLEKGEYVKAKELVEKGIEIVEKAGAKYMKMSNIQFLVLIHLELGEIEKAKNLVDDLQQYAHEKNDKQLIANADLSRAVQFRAQKRWEESIEYFEKCLQEFEALNARRWNVYMFARYVLFEYARVYLERDQKGDREKAYNLLNQAFEIFERLGAKKDIEKILAKKKLLTA
jgi:tetratricopeptide (TPR) repeat protein